jgi:hypothetical protein
MCLHDLSLPRRIPEDRDLRQGLDFHAVNLDFQFAGVEHSIPTGETDRRLDKRQDRRPRRSSPDRQQALTGPPAMRWRSPGCSSRVFFP